MHGGACLHHEKFSFSGILKANTKTLVRSVRSPFHRLFLDQIYHRDQGGRCFFIGAIKNKNETKNRTIFHHLIYK